MVIFAQWGRPHWAAPNRRVPVGRRGLLPLGEKDCSILTKERILQCLNYLKILQKKIIYLF